MGSIPCVQMVLNLDPSSSPTHTRFDLSPFTSFQPLPLFASLPHYRFWSSEDPATLTTTRAPSFISTLLFRTFSQNRNTDQAAALVGSPCEHNPKASSDQLQNVSSSVCECGDSHHKSSALRLTPQFEAGPPRDTKLALSCHERSYILVALKRAFENCNPLSTENTEAAVSGYSHTPRHRTLSVFTLDFGSGTLSKTVLGTLPCVSQ